MMIKKTTNRNHVTPGTETESELKMSSKSNSPIIITPVFTIERPGFENAVWNTMVMRAVSEDQA